MHVFSVPAFKLATQSLASANVGGCLTVWQNMFFIIVGADILLQESKDMYTD
jgi:hypothetical protein